MHNVKQTCLFFDNTRKKIKILLPFSRIGDQPLFLKGFGMFLLFNYSQNRSSILANNKVINSLM